MHKQDGLAFCYVVEPRTCSHPGLQPSTAFEGAKWLPCDPSVNYPWPE